LTLLLQKLAPGLSMVHQHLWLIELLQWVRGDATEAAPCVARIQALLIVLERNPAIQRQAHDLWQRVVQRLDGSTLLADYGFASRNALVGELIQRLHLKLLPRSPETQDASELFALAMPQALDAVWIAALPEQTLHALAELLTVPPSRHHAHCAPPFTDWQCTVLDALIFCTSQVRASGFEPEIRLRANSDLHATSPFYALSSHLDDLCAAWRAGLNTDQAAQNFKLQLESCRHFAATVYTHLDTHGISVDLVFRLRQMRERVLRIRSLMDCLLLNAEPRHVAHLIAHLVQVGQESASLGALFNANASLLAAKVAERSSVAGEKYLARTRLEYRAMLVQAAGGGAVTAFTTALKFALAALGLASFWYGFTAGVVYALSFVLIQLLHFTLATKQPAMTAPAMAAKLKDLSQPSAVDGFVDEVCFLVRSQAAAVLGNVLAVFPCVLLISMLMQVFTGASMIGAATAHQVLDSLSLLGPSLLFAALTGVLLFASSIIAGWVENWFVLHRLDSALRYNPQIVRRLGAQRAQRLATFMLHQVSGLASSVSLGMMLGLAPPVLAFLGLPLELRHVTLSTGQMAAACAALGWPVWREPALWWALACLPLIGVMNVAVSFYLAFRLALRAHNVGGVDRAHILRTIVQRLKTHPGAFFWPQRQDG